MAKSQDGSGHYQDFVVNPSKKHKKGARKVTEGKKREVTSKMSRAITSSKKRG